MDPAVRELFLRRDELHGKLVKSDRRYVHPETVNNLLAHIDEIENAADKAWAVRILENYFDTCEGNLPNIDRALGFQLYDEHLRPLLRYYDRNLRFVNHDPGVSLIFHLGLITIGMVAFGIKGGFAVLLVVVIRVAWQYEARTQGRAFALFY